MAVRARAEVEMRLGMTPQQSSPTLIMINGAGDRVCPACTQSS